jgi:hypothetical protein
MYIKLTNGIPENYSIGQLRRDNPQTSFPKNIPDSTLADFSVYPIQVITKPEVDYTKNVTEGTPVNQDGQWAQVWNVTEATDEEIKNRIKEFNQQQEQNRLEAYRNEADPLFFKTQRGEATIDEWKNKVLEIKNRYQDITNV